MVSKTGRMEVEFEMDFIFPLYQHPFSFAISMQCFRFALF